MAGDALSIKLRCASWQQLATIYRRDLSRGAMFLKAATQPPLGTSVRIDLTLPSATVVQLTGVVEQHVQDPQRGPGVELKLAPIAPSAVWIIESALASEVKRKSTPPSGVSANRAQTTGPIAAIGENAEVVEAEHELMQALLAEAESLRRVNSFLVLGVGYEATDADVRAAFNELTKRYHPDRFARYESTELRTLAAEIFILIRDAYRKLGDQAGRQQVLQSLGRAPAPRAVASRTIPPPNPRQTQKAPVVPPPGGTREPARPSSSGSFKRAPTEPAAPPPVRPTSPPPKPIEAISEPNDASGVEALIDQGKYDEALLACRDLVKRHPHDRWFRAGIELCEGMRALANRDRLEAAQRFESALEIDPSNERAAQELADMRRQATNERKGLLSRLMGKKEP